MARGSSPHTRGAPYGIGFCKVSVGIIPAYAGSTCTDFLRSPNSWDHPRIRGEHPLIGECKASTVGSSPHTRGAPQARLWRHRHRRIIPAYAGSTAAGAARWSVRGDHPRIRGEHALIRRDVHTGEGSSPHTRGALVSFDGSSQRRGIIPAYAGSTGWPAHHIKPHPDHPRIRGEHEANSLDGQTMAGSSPHTRGALRKCSSIRSGVWIIPAYAGSTSPSPPRRTGFPDHPRIRGEHDQMVVAELEPLGSSPHTRGARLDSKSRGGTERIIPAYAGSTTAASISRISQQDHPRIRGEHS